MLTIPSPNYYPGRREALSVIVLHTAQVPCLPGRAESTLRYLSRAAVRASAHWAVDPATTVAGVAEPDTAWATPGVNANGCQVEQAGYAEFGCGARIPGRMGDADGYEAARQAYGVGAIWPAWTDPEPARMIATQTVPLVAGICARHGIPPVLLEPDDLRAGRWGITDHARAAAAFDPGGHWDCGPNYPLAPVVRDVAAILTGTNPPGDPEDMPAPVLLIQSPATGTLFWWDGQTRAPISPAPGVFATFDDLAAGLARLIDSHPSAARWPDGALYRVIPVHDLELIPYS